MNFFEVKIKHEIVTENGIQKTVTEPFIIDALSFTEAESRMIKHCEEHNFRDVKVKSIVEREFDDIIDNDNDDDFWFEAKVEFTNSCEKSGREKKTTAIVLLNASDINHAKSIMDKQLESVIIPCSLKSIKETKIVDYIKYSE